MKIEEICRTCLSESSDLRSIFKLGVIAGKATTLSKVLMEFGKLTVNESDPYPDKMCYGCVLQANQSFAFLQTCLESDRYLKEKLGKGKTSVRISERKDEHTIIAEPQTRTVYLYNAVNIEGEDEIKVHIAPSEIKVIKSNSPSQNNNDDQIILNSDDRSEHEQTEINVAAQDIIEDDNLETEIIEIDHDGGNSNSSFDNIHNDGYFDEHSTSNTMKNDINKSMEDVNFDFSEENENGQIIKNEIEEEEEEMSDDVKKRQRKVRPYPGKMSFMGPPYICSICQKQLSTRSSMKYHMQLHSNSTPFLCNQCGEGFKTRNAYEGHMTTHDANNPHYCKICGKNYRQANSLKTHMLTHTGEKPFLCGICGKGMTQKSGFKKHMLVHSGEMPFECDLCHKKFRYSSNLIAHKKTHTEHKDQILYMCKICDKLFKSPSERKSHMTTHRIPSHSKITSECPICGKIFIKIEALDSHIKLVHKKSKIGQQTAFLIKSISEGK